MPPVSRFEGFGIVLTQLANGIRVEQGPHSYLARRLRLNEDLVAVVTQFAEAGFCCVIRTSHPQPRNRERGVDYIGFSRGEHDPWLAVVDRSSRHEPIQFLTVRSTYRDLLIEHCIPFRWEPAGGKNMFIAREHAGSVLMHFAEIVDRSNDPSNDRARRYPLPILTKESVLQSRVLEVISSTPQAANCFGKIVSVFANPTWPPSDDPLDPQNRDIPDVIVLTNDSLWVVELKLNELSWSAVDQVSRYANNRSCRELAGSRVIKPVVIGHRKHPDLEGRCTISSRGIEVAIWLYEWNVTTGLRIHCRDA